MRLYRQLPVFVIFNLCWMANSATGYGQDFTSSNLPIIVIETMEGDYIPDEPKVYAHMGVIFNGDGQVNNISDPFNNYDGIIGIERRGSSSQSFPKAQYSIELWTPVGSDSSAALLGMPMEEDWVLFAPYNDKSLMRDWLAYKLGNDMGRYAPRTKYCELILNGEYQGIYVLMEKIKRDPKRVDISKLEPEDNSGDDITGGYILKLDKFSGNGGSGFVSQVSPENNQLGQQIVFQYDYPEPEVITFEQQRYIKQYVTTFESVLIGKDYDNPFQGYRAYIDVGSFVDFMIMNEVSKNVDGYRLSTYLNKDKNSSGGLLKMGPIWDFNLGFGNANYCTSGEPFGFVYEFNSICSQDYWLIPFWWKRLLQDSYYKKKLVARWMELRAGKFSTSNVHAYIDSVAMVLNQESQQRNFQRWPVLNTWIWPNLYVGATFQDEVNFLKEWVSQRMDWLDNQWDEGYVTSAEEGIGVTVNVFPNPSPDHWMIKSEKALSQAALQLVDVYGNIRYSQELAGIKRLDVIIDGGQLAPGLYFLKIRSGSHSEVRKIIKSN
jgi:hypothetical protein